MSQAADSQGRDDSAVMGQAVHTAGSHGRDTVDDFSRDADAAVSARKCWPKISRAILRPPEAEPVIPARMLTIKRREQRHALTDTEEGISDFQEARQGRNDVAVANFRCRVHDSQQRT